MRLVRRLQNMRISTQLALAFLAMGMLLITAVTYVAYTSARGYLTAEVTRRINLIADLKVGEIENYLAHYTAGLRGLARTPTVLAALQSVSQAARVGKEASPPGPGLTRVLVSHREAFRYRAVVLAPANGVAATIHQIEQGRLVSRAVTNIENDPALGDVLSDARASQEARVRFHHDSEIGLQAFVAGPAWEDGRLVGILALELSTDELDSIVGGLSGLGASGETVLVAMRGDSVAILAPTRHDPRAPRGERTAIGARTAVPEQHAARGIEASEVATDYRGERVLATTRHLAGLNWGLAVKIDAAEAFAPVTGLRASVALLALVSSVLLVLAALSLARLVVTPVGALVRAIDRFRHTGLLPELPTRGPVEIRTLGRAFSNMVANLGETHDRLRDSVSRLAEKNDALAAEVERRMRSEAELTTLAESLEQRVADRTTELEASRSAALQSEERFRLLFEYAPDAYFLHDLDGRFVDGNRAAERLTGHRRESLIGKTFANSGLLPAAELPRAARSLALTRIGEATPPQEFRLNTKDGRQAIVEIRSFPLRIEDQYLVLGVARDITDRKKVEQEVRERDETIRAIVETSKDWIWAIDTQGLHTYSNPAVEDILGYRPEEIAGRSSAAFLHEDDRRLIEAELPALKTEKRGWSNLLLRWRHKDGSYRYLESSAAPILDAHGELSGFRGVDRDVSDRIRSEEVLRESQKRLSMHVQQTPLGVIEWDLDFRVVEWNPAAERIFRFTREDTCGRHPAEFILPEEVRPHVDRVWQDLLLQRGGHRSTNENLTKDGLRIHCEWYNTPLIDDNGEVISVVSLVQDVTDRVQAEQALRLSEEKYRTLFEDAPYGIYRATVAGRFLAVNPALVTMLGYDSAEELLQIDLRTALYADPAERSRLLGPQRGSEPIVGAETEWKRKDGKHISVRLSGRPFRDDAGKLAGFEMLVEDVSQRRALEAQLRQAQKMEAVGQLTGGIAHDFNNLLSVILLNTQLLKSTIEAGQPVLSSDLRDLEAASQKAATMTRQLLRFSRRADLEPAPTNLSEVIRGFATMLRRVLPENIELRLAADDKVPRVLADSGAVEQMILNLATNARDAMPDGGQLRIDVDERVLDTAACSGHPWMAPGRYVCITVGDTGVGMDEETQSRIFEPFFTTKPAGVGTGLGLAMVYGLMHQQGGCAHVCSEPGQGTTIRLHFPAADTRVTAAADANGDGTKRRILRGDETILLVEDEASLREMCQQVLEHYGYTVVVAADGMEALRAYREDPGRFDLVISDVVMPNMGGADLARVLASEFGSPRLLLVSGYAAWDAGARRGLDPSIPVLEKPWSLEQFLEHVRHALNASRDDQEAHGSRSAIAETGVDS